MEQSKDFTFDFNTTMDRFYKLFSELIDKELTDNNDSESSDLNNMACRK